MLALALALAPVVAILWYILFLDRLNKEPVKMLIRTFLFGILSIVPAILFETFGLKALGSVDTVFKAAIQAFIIIALSEEVAKYFFLRKFVYNRPEFDEPFDGIVYAVMISMGFAAFENIMYVSSGGVQVAILRMFTAVPAHATFAVLMGYFVGRAKMENKPMLNWVGLGAATLFHGLYDFFLLTELFEGQVVGALLSLIVGLLFARSAIRIHQRHKQLNA